MLTPDVADAGLPPLFDRRKFTLKIQEQEEHIETLMAKLSQVEKQKSRLQSEVEVLIIDLEKANGSCRDLQKRCELLERMNNELKSKVSSSVPSQEFGCFAVRT